MIDGIELFTLRQRRSADGKTFFTGKLGGAAVVVVQDDFEPDLWKVLVGDPFQSREERPRSKARALAAPDADGWYQDHTMSDDIPESWDVPQLDSERR